MKAASSIYGSSINHTSMKKAIYLTTTIALLIVMNASGQVKSITSDTQWELQQAVLKNTPEAACIIRMGDVDNLGFGWPDDFDPFCGRMTAAHSWPWESNKDDLPGFDRILLSSKFDPSKIHDCDGDGYSESYDPSKTKPVAWNIATDALKGMTIQNIYLQLFIDDFQAPSFCSRFQLLINGKRFVEGEKVLNAIDQTGPVGKLISIPLTEEFYPLLTGGSSVSIMIDESTGAADGFAVDFIRLLANRKRENSCKGTVRGVVLDKETEQPVAGAHVFSMEGMSAETDAQGKFELRNIPTGFEVLSARAAGYEDGTGTADIGEGDENQDVFILLTKGKSAAFGNRQIKVGESITLDNILFDQGKADIRPESRQTLDNVADFLKANPTAEIELSGHTSSEGDAAYNRSLSYKRVNACKQYITSKGIAEDRIFAVGHGPDHPIAPNDTEANRAKNRRVEMRLKKL